jgi:hypothetical protein
LKSRYSRQRLRHGACFADYLKLRVGTEEIDQPAPDNFVVIDKKDLDHMSDLREVFAVQRKR